MKIARIKADVSFILGFFHETVSKNTNILKSIMSFNINKLD